MDKQKLKQAIEFAKQNPDSEYANELRKRIETGQIVIEKEQPSYLQRVGEQYGNIAERTTGALKKSGEGYLEKAQQGDILGATGELLRSGLRSVGAVAEGAFAPITEAPGIKQALDFIGEKLGNTEIGQKLAQKMQENPEKAQDIMDIINTLTLGGGKVAEQPIKVGAEKALTTGKQALKTGIDTLKTKEAIKTASSVDDLVGKITQGLEKDIPRAKKALSDIETSGIKTYKDLSSTLNDKVSNLTTKLDEILGQNTTKIGLEDAKNIIKVGEKSVEHNFVKDAISQLEDYFIKTNDISAKEGLNQLKNKFNREGLTIKDINDLARLHGEKMNAYNASGELASGLTKQAAENTRAGLKSTARDLFGDKVYKEIDSEISNVIRTRDLVDNVAKKVTQLQQKINQRGFGEKVGRLVFQVADKFTGGGLKGFVQSFVPRGEGLKIMNALDLERSLNKNLKLLDKAMNSKTESATIKALEGILDYIENPKMGLSIEDVSKKVKGGIPETKLLTEAKKYNSAEAFVKAQGETVYTGKIKDMDLDYGRVAQKGNQLPYGVHFTPDENIAKSFASGETKGLPTGNKGIVESASISAKNPFDVSATGNNGEHLFFKGSKQYDILQQIAKKDNLGDLSEIYSKQSGGHFIPKENAIKYSDSKLALNPNWILDKAKPNTIKLILDKNGYDPVIKYSMRGTKDPLGMGLPTFTDAYAVLDKSAIKTKSQLTDIWKKANKK